MKIPNECNTKEFQTAVLKWAMRMLTYGYRFRPKFNREVRFKHFDLDLYDDDIQELAKDLVQDCWLVISSKPEPSTPIRNWYAFFSFRLSLIVQSKQRKNERTPRRVGLEVPITQTSENGEEVRPIDIIEASQMTYEEEEKWSEWVVQMNAAYHEMIAAVEKILDQRLMAGNIRDKSSVPEFLEMVRQYLLDPEVKFDTYRNSHGQGISTETAGRWWKAIRDRLPIPIDHYKRLAKGEIG
jgi:hypothetical protein